MQVLTTNEKMFTAWLVIVSTVVNSGQGKILLLKGEIVPGLYRGSAEGREHGTNETNKACVNVRMCV